MTPSRSCLIIALLNALAIALPLAHDSARA